MWFLSLLTSPEKLEMVTNHLNTKLGAVIEGRLESYKSSSHFRIRLEADVKTKFDQLIANSLSNKVLELEKEQAEKMDAIWKSYAVQKAIFVQEFIERIQEQKEKSIPTPPPNVSYQTTPFPTLPLSFTVPAPPDTSDDPIIIRWNDIEGAEAKQQGRWLDFTTRPPRHFYDAREYW